MPNPSIEDQLAQLRSELAELRSQQAQVTPRSERPLFRVFVAVLVAALAFAGTTAAQLITFAPGTPAQAGAVNANFQQLKS